VAFLAPFFNMGLTSANFNHVGKMPEDNILLHMYHKGEEMY